jgi:hypothetical protein
LHHVITDRIKDQNIKKITQEYRTKHYNAQFSLRCNVYTQKYNSNCDQV